MCDCFYLYSSLPRWACLALCLVFFFHTQVDKFFLSFCQYGLFFLFSLCLVKSCFCFLPSSFCTSYLVVQIFPSILLKPFTLWTLYPFFFLESTYYFFTCYVVIVVSYLFCLLPEWKAHEGRDVWLFCNDPVWRMLLEFDVFHQFGKLSASISSTIASLPFFPSRTPITHALNLSLYFMCHRLLSVFPILWASVWKFSANLP